MIEKREREAPRSWAEIRRSARFKWLVPILYVDWLTDWAAFLLSRSAFLEFLEYCGTLSILVAVIVYFMDAPERTKLKHYQAWQVINTAQGKGGSGGRNDALHELNEDHVPLVGVDLSDAFLQNLDLQQADLRRSVFRNADLKGANLGKSDMEQSGLRSANLRNADLSGVNFSDCDLNDADLTGARLSGCRLDRADLRNADLSGLTDWSSIVGIRLADIYAVEHAPSGFIEWAKSQGAVEIAADEDFAAAVAKSAAGK